MPPSLSITSWILAGIVSTRFYRKFVSAVLWARPGGWPPLTGQNPPQGRLRHLQCFLMVSKGTPALQSSTATLLNQFWSFFPVCVCWASIAVLCQENDVWRNLYHPASDKKYSSKNDEISYSSSQIHALLPKKIWGFYLIQEKSY